MYGQMGRGTKSERERMGRGVGGGIEDKHHERETCKRKRKGPLNGRKGGKNIITETKKGVEQRQNYFEK